MAMCLAGPGYYYHLAPFREMEYISCLYDDDICCLAANIAAAPVLDMRFASNHGNIFGKGRAPRIVIRWLGNSFVNSQQLQILVRRVTVELLHGKARKGSNIDTRNFSGGFPRRRFDVNLCFELSTSAWL